MIMAVRQFLFANKGMCFIVAVTALSSTAKRGIWSRADLHVESWFVHHLSQARSMRDMETCTHNSWHLNAAGDAIADGRTLPAIEALVRKVEKRR
jgi:hypothetical protein